MVVNKRKKAERHRGSITHGGGSRKKRRGAGSRGGRGNAGTGKRAGQKKAGMDYKLGSYGFTRGGRGPKEITINVGSLTAVRINKWLTSGKATKESNHYVVDLEQMGYEKLLGTGTTKLKLKLKVAKFSASAENKIKEAGGEIVSDFEAE